MGVWRNGIRGSLKSCSRKRWGFKSLYPYKGIIMKFYYCAMAAGIFIIEGSKILTDVLQHIWIVETNAKTI